MKSLAVVALPSIEDVGLLQQMLAKQSLSRKDYDVRKHSIYENTKLEERGEKDEINGNSHLCLFTIYY